MIGYPLLVVAVAWFLYKLYMSYASAGGTQLEVPVYDGAIYPPIIAVGGTFLLVRDSGATWSVWIYIGLWAVLTALAAGAIRLAEEFGDRPLK